MPELSPYFSNIIGALAAGTVGAGASHFMTRKVPNEDEEQFKKRRSLNTSLGLLGGAAVGAATPEAAAALQKVMGNPDSKSYWNPVNWLYGAADGIAGVTGPLPLAGAAAGAYGTGRAVEKSQDRTAESLKGKLDTAISEAKIPHNNSVIGMTRVDQARDVLQAHESGVGRKVNVGRAAGGVGGAVLGGLLEHTLGGL